MPMRSERRRGFGFTLFETVLVVAIIVIAVALAYPTIRTMYGYYKLQGAVDSVRAAWAQARGRAIQEGRPYRFAVEDNGSHFRIAPDRQDYWSGSPPADDPEGHGMVVEQALPAGVHFTPSDNPSAAPEASTSEETPPSSGNWSALTVFLPNGQAKDNVSIVFTIKGVKPMLLRLRGLTGTSTVQSMP